jgi:hypothetical protein
MSLKRRLLTCSAGVALAAGFFTAVPLTATAATQACGENCISVFNRGLGTYERPNIVETILGGKAEVGTSVVLAPVGQNDPAQDTIPDLRMLDSFYGEGLISKKVYRRWRGFPAVQIQYAPLGVGTGMCVGLDSAPRQGQGLTLQPCGVSARTVWILDIKGVPQERFFAIINSATKKIRRPFAMDYAGPAPEGETPEPIRVRRLEFKGKDRLLPDRQVWGAAQGVLG